MTGHAGFERVWRFRAAAGREAEFERVYGSAGAWSQLFALHSGYCGTELRRVTDDPAEYEIVDRWASRRAWEAFLRDHRAEYDRLDRQCEPLTAAESFVRESEASASLEAGRRSDEAGR